MNAIGERLYERHFGRPRIAGREMIRERLTRAAEAAGLSFGGNFLLTEWEDVVDAWQLSDW